MAEHVILKLSIYLFNLILLVCGLALVVGGSIAQIRFRDHFNALPGKVFIAPILLIVGGVVMVLIAIFGCFGTCKRKSWTLILFATLLAAVFLLEIAASVVAYLERNTVNGYMEARMNQSMTELGYRNNTGQGDLELWDSLQRMFGCCGEYSYTDWITALGPNKVRTSCCRWNATEGCADADVLTACDAATVSVDDVNKCPIYTRGCLIGVGEKIKEHIGMVGGIGLGVAALQVLGVILGACLANKIRKDGEL